MLPCLMVLGSGGQSVGGQAGQPQTLKNALGMEFVRIPPGEFMMGCSTGDEQCDADEKPRHRVVITGSFEIGRHEVTQAQWVAVMGSNPSSSKGDNRPVETVSKLEAQEFIAKLNTANDGHTYRLPTEAEWEYAARAGAEGPYSGPLDEVAWYAANSEEETHPVGQKKPNAWGLYDVQGNVREWVSDFYSPTYYGVSPISDPTGPSTSEFTGQPALGPRGNPGVQGPPQRPAFRFQSGSRTLPPGPPGATSPGPPVAGPAVEVSPGVLVDPIDGLPTGLPIVRGGAWDQSARFQRVSARYSYYGPTLRLSDIGLRVARVPVLQPK